MVAVSFLPWQASAAVDETNTVDVLFVYTPLVKARNGGADGVLALANSLIDDTNEAFINSGVEGSLRLADAVEVNYEESDSYATDLARVVTGKIPGVHDLREAVKADLVCLLRQGTDSQKLSGISHFSVMDGYGFPAPELAFSVVSASVASRSADTFAHQIGHNLGCGHDLSTEDIVEKPQGYDGLSGGRFSDSHGFLITGTSDGRPYRTIMAYGTSTRVMRFSNPNRSYRGAPTGNATANNARTLNQSLKEASKYYAARPHVAKPAISPAGNFIVNNVEVPFVSPQAIIIGTSTPNAVLRYTLGGAPVTEDSQIYNGALTLRYSDTLKVRAFREGYLPSETVVATYHFRYGGSLVGKPIANRTGGTYTDSVTILVTAPSSNPDAIVRFTTDGTDVNEFSPQVTGAIVLTKTTTLKLRAYQAQRDPSPQLEYAYVVTFSPRALKPLITPPGGDQSDEVPLQIAHNGPLYVTLSSPRDVEETIRYTTNGSDVTEQSPAYSGPFLVSETTTVKARSFHSAYKESRQSEATFTITPVVAATPEIIPFGGNAVNSVTVRLRVSSPGAVLRYTLDGSEVTETSPIYSGQITRTEQTTVKVRAFGVGYLPGEQVTAIFGSITSADILAQSVQRISAAGSHSFFITSTGDLRATGSNQYGQLGTGTTNSTSTPVPVLLEPGVQVKSVDGLRDHTLFLSEDNTLWGVGRNDYGQLGSGTLADKQTPVRVATDVQSFSAGGFHSLYVSTDGTLWAIGRNNYGQLGDGTTTRREHPVAIAQDVLFASAGPFNSFFVTTDGTLWGTGRNEYGQLGDGTNSHRLFPVRLADSVIAVSAGEQHTLYLTADGTLWGMGRNTYGQLGLGSFTGNLSPVKIADGVVAIAAGSYHSLFINTQGELYAMGRNESGQLGGGTTANQIVPVLVESNVRAVSAGATHTVYTLVNGTTKSVGGNDYGQLGNGTTSGGSNSTPVPELPPAKTPAISPGGGSFALGSVTVTISSIEPDATIRYTTDGSNVAEDSPLYTGPFDLFPAPGVVQTVSARAFLDEHSPSGQASANYIIALPPDEQLPVIIQQPRPIAGTAGVPATFAISAIGTPDPTYQWQFNGTDIPFATDASYQITSPSDSDVGSYRVIVSNSAGSVASNTVSLTLQNAPVITRQPVAWTVTVGQSVSFSVGAVGNPDPIYQWRRNGVNIPGATNPTYAIPYVLPENAGSYDVIIGNVAGSISSNTVQLTVRAPDGPPLLTRQPESQTVWQGEPVTFSVGAVSEQALSYQWYFKGRQIKGANGASYTISKTSKAQAGSYSVSASNQFGQVTSASVGLTVQVPVKPKITKAPQKIETGLGRTVTLSVEATANPQPGYQWLLNGKPIEGATDRAYVIQSVAETDLGRYSVVVTSGQNSTTSKAAEISAVLPPAIATPPQHEVFALVGSGAKLSVKLASNKAKVSYQWIFNGVDIRGANKSTYTAKVEGVYSLRATNSAGSVVGEVATVKLITPPQIGSVVASEVNVVAGDSISLQVFLLSGTETLHYAWKFNGKPIADAPDEPFYRTAPIFKDGRYSVTVTNGGGKVVGKATSRPIAVKVITPPLITKQPVGLILSESGTGTLSVSASGTAKLTYQWFRNGIPIANATESKLVLRNVSVFSSGTYYVEVSNPSKRVVRSEAVEVRVNVAGSSGSSLRYATGGSLDSSSVNLPSSLNKGVVLEAAPSSITLDLGTWTSLGGTVRHLRSDITSISDPGVLVLSGNRSRFVLSGLLEDSSGNATTYNDVIEFQDEQVLKGGATYTAETGDSTLRLSYRLDSADEAIGPVEYGEILFTFTSSTSGTYTVTGFFEQGEDGELIPGSDFSGSGTFVFENGRSGQTISIAPQAED
jgi:alpha-tubulin suppressor-like RCC1 family protein